MALAARESAVLAGPLSQHTKTAIHFATLLSGGKAKFSLGPVGESPDTQPQVEQLITSEDWAG